MEKNLSESKNNQFLIQKFDFALAFGSSHVMFKFRPKVNLDRMRQEKYDTIGVDYNSTRRADKYLASRMMYHLSPDKSEKYLDIGCGTGNYTAALWKEGINFIGVDPSSEMLQKARAMKTDIDWRQGRVEKIPVKDESVEGVLASLTIHHWSDLEVGFKEISRVLKSNGRIAIFTSSSKQMEGYWLNHYFPKMMEKSIRQMPALSLIENALINTGFRVIEKEPYFVKPDLNDLFLYAGKERPSLYLKEEVRAGISSFSSLSNASEVQKGLKVLENDIESGEINKIMEGFVNDQGDYLFLSAIKAG